MMLVMVFSWDKYCLTSNCHHPEMLMTMKLFIDYLRGYKMKPFVIIITV